VLADGRELRLLRRRNAGALEDIQYPVLHRDGRVLATGGNDWLSFFDLASGEELASVRQPRRQALCPTYFDPSGGWVTSGTSVLLWPARPDVDRPEVLRVGPSQLLSPIFGSPSASANGRVMAVPQGTATVVLHRDHPERRVALGPQYDARFSAVSPDGRLVVTGSHWNDQRSKSDRIWDAESGERVHKLPLIGSTLSRFSPNGRWLMTATGSVGCRLWEVGTWREVQRFDYAASAFSPDSRLLAISDVFSVIRLVETTTGREVARLTGPEPMWYPPACFTPDGTRLIASSSETRGLYVWDLRLIRQQLKGLGLDWDWSEFPPADPASESPAPRQVEIRTGDLAKLGPTPEQRARQAIERYSREVEANPDSARACNNLAWVYLTAPEPLRDGKAALPLAEKAMRLVPENALYRNTVGVAYYRAGRYREAVEALRPNLEGQEDWGLAFDLYFLAMSHRQLGEAARARDYNDWAVRWTRAQQGLSEGYLEELALFRAEAAELLGIDKKN
jgi:hypothetical protein